MVTVVARRIAAVPVRTAVETWETIVELVTAADSDARIELTDVTSIAAMLIADEQTKDEPIMIAGGGPLVRIYTVHGEIAIEHDAADEAELAFNPTGGDGWTLTLPASGADAAIVEAAVLDAPHVNVRDVEAADEDEERAVADASIPAAAFEFDLSELERP